MKTEYDCEKCGIHVIACIPVPDETIWCLECRFLEGIEDEEVRREAKEFLAKIRGEDSWPKS